MDKLETAARAAAEVWKCPVNQVAAHDLTSSYPWVHQHTVVMVQNADFVRMLVAIDRKGEATVFHHPANVAEISRLFQSEKVKLPDGIGAEQLALTLRTFLLGPGGFVGSKAFWNEQKDAIKLWTLPSPQDGPKLFEDCCQDPTVQQNPGGWKLVFFYFNNKGGVERWQAAGDTAKVQEAKPEPVVPDRKFSFPYG